MTDLDLDALKRRALRRIATITTRAFWQGCAYLGIKDEEAMAIHNHAWAHRNDGKISMCKLCGKIRDNEP